MHNLFLVKSPLQLLNAIEAKHYFKLDQKSCILVLMCDKKSMHQMQELAKAHEKWGEIIFIDNVSPFFGLYRKNIIDASFSLFRLRFLKSSFFMVRKLNALARCFNKIDHLFIGDNYNSFMRHFINKSSHKSLILLDDGVGAIYMAEIRRKGFKTAPVDKLKKRIKLTAKRLMQGLNDRQADHVCFFSVYDLELSENDTQIKNNYKYLRQESENIEATDNVYFIGTVLPETGFVTNELYMNNLKQVIEYFKGRTVVYVAHRREDYTKLQKIKEELNVEVIQFDYPIEFQLAMIGPKPKIITTFFSSAVENLRLIMGDQLRIVSFRLRKGTYNNKERVDSIYAYYEKNLSDNFVVESLK